MRRLVFRIVLCLAMTSAAAAPSVGRAAGDGPPIEAGQTATPMPDGRWLVLGGLGAGGPLDRAALWDPRAGILSPLPPLRHARAWHTATLMPDGGVLVVGGLGAESVGERFTVERGSAPLAAPGAAPRVRHTATLMTDGAVLIAGGLDTGGESLATAELWQLAAGGAAVAPLRLSGARSGHAATLAPDGSVILSGGIDADGAPRVDAERFDPATVRFAPVASPVDGEDAAAFAGSLPEAGAIGVPLDAVIALRFSAGSPPASLDGLALTGPEGPRPIRIVPAEEGRLLFVTPLAPLSPGATYVVSAPGDVDPGGPLAGLAPIAFTTAADASHAPSPPSRVPSRSPDAFPTPEDGSAASAGIDAPAPSAGSGSAAPARRGPRPAAASFADAPPPATAPTPGGDAWDGRSVDLSTGIFVHRTTDLFLDAAMPVALTRTYRSGDASVRPFGVGTSHPYQVFVSLAPPYQEARLVLEDGTALRFARTTPGTDLPSAVFRHTDTPTAYFGATLAGLSFLRLVRSDGVVYDLGVDAPVQRILDDYGRLVEVLRHGAAQGPEHGVVASVLSNADRWIVFGYDALDRIVQARDTLGRIAGYAYDAAGRLVTFTDPDGGVTRYTYDAAHRMLTIRDPRGIVTLQNDYDGAGRVVRQVLADGAEYRFAYTAGGDGRVARTEVTGPRGSVRRVDFDARGHRVSDTRALGTPIAQTTLYERDAAGFVTATTDALGRRTTFARDAMGRVTSVTRLAGAPEAATTRLSYAPAGGLGIGRLASITDPLGHVTAVGYDAAGFPARVVDPAGSVARLAGFEGLTLQVGDALGNATEVARGIDDDVVQIVDPIGRATALLRDGGGRLLSRVSAAGTRTSWAYDRFDRPVQITDGAGGVTRLQYDAGGNLVAVTDPRGKVTTLARDGMGRVTGRTDPLGRTEHVEYDASGNLSRATDRNGQATARSYDALDRLTAVTYADGGTATYEWDAGDRLVRIVDSAAGEIARAWDALDRLSSETGPDGTVAYTYDAAGRRASMTVDAAPPVTYEYDAAGRVTRIAQGAVAVAAAYDAAGQRTSLALPGGITAEYAYDAASQLVGLTYRRGGEPIGTLTYGYDRAGRRVRVGGTWARAALPPAMAAATYDDAGRVASFGGVAATHDADGNLTHDGVRTYVWNARRQLVAVDGGGVAARFAYDALGRRREVQLGSAITRALHDGLAIASRMGPDGVDLVLSDPDGEAPLAFGDSGDLRVPLTDAVGSVAAVGDGAGAVASAFTYQPFGAGAPGGGFGGGEDDGTGLQFHRTRYYHPALHRFASSSAAGPAGGRTTPYAYARNDPVGRADALGLDAEPRRPPAASLALEVEDPAAGPVPVARALRVAGLGDADLRVVERLIGAVASPEQARAVDAIERVDGAAAPCPPPSPLRPWTVERARAAWLVLPAGRCDAPR